MLPITQILMKSYFFPKIIKEVVYEIPYDDRWKLNLWLSRT